MKLPVLSWIACVLLLIGLMAYLGRDVVDRAPVPTRTQGEALIGGSFNLVDGHGKPVTDQDFHGQYLLIYFGFTHCPDICPTSLLLMQNALDQLGDRAARVTPVFITLDPERDTPAIVGKYVANFGLRFVGLSGTPAQVRQVAEAYKVYYQKVTHADSAMGYVIDHSGFLYLMDPDGKYIAHFPHRISEQSLTNGLNEAIK